MEDLKDIVTRVYQIDISPLTTRQESNTESAKLIQSYANDFAIKFMDWQFDLTENDYRKMFPNNNEPSRLELLAEFDKALQQVPEDVNKEVDDYIKTDNFKAIADLQKQLEEKEKSILELIYKNEMRSQANKELLEGLKDAHRVSQFSNLDTVVSYLYNLIKKHDK